MGIEGSTVVVVGGTSGIGLATAQAAAAAGARVVVGSRRQERLDAALRDLPAGVTGHLVDAGDPESLAVFFARIGTVDHLAYTAADALSTVYLRDFTAEAFESFMGLRVVGALATVRAALPHLSPAASVTLTSGTAAYRPGPGWLMGALACGAMISAARGLALELAPVRINVVAPGVVRSPLWDDLGETDREALYAGVASSLPLGRVAEVEDCGRAFVSLMEQDYVTGTVSVVDGGTLLV